MIRFVAYCAAILLAGCAPTLNATNFQSSPLAASQSVSGLSLGRVEVVIPESMGVATDPSIRVPDPNLLNWWEDPPGDRKAQVSSLLKEAAERGARKALTGTKAVLFRLKVNKFHALTPRARATNIQLGVHTMNFDFSLIDMSTGAVIATEADINADIRAYSGTEAIMSEARGESQKSRIQDQVSEVVRQWLMR